MKPSTVASSLTGAAAAAASFLLVFSGAALAGAPKPLQHPIALAHRPAPFGRHSKAVCPPVPGGARCYARVLTAQAGHVAPAVVTALPDGYGPADLQRAYELSSLSAASGGGQTVAIVDAYDDPTAEHDLGAYRSTYGLSSCTAANGCFRKVDQSGGKSYPAADSGWAQETALDLAMVSAIAPNAKILLVEANSASFAALAAATNEAATLGATQISNSYGADEVDGVAYAGSYRHPGVAVVASSGDAGYGCDAYWAPCFPASVPAVEAVGGTSLSSIAPRTESAWADTGSGCSTRFAKPAWQQDPSCPLRSVGDVSAVADPATGVAVYTSALGGWAVFGGTSAAAPIVAGFDALIGSPASSPQWAYRHPSAFNDVTTGSNDRPRSTCHGSYLCNAGPGYDGPSGLGTPSGAGAPWPSASTAGATDVGLSTATIAGSVNPDGAATGYRFDYGTTSDYGSSSAVGDAGSGTEDVAVSAALSGLTPNTTYHYRLVALRGGSVAATSGDQTLTTRALAPSASTGGTTDVGLSTATIAGSVNPDGAATGYRFDYGTTSDYGSSSAVGDAGSGTDDVAVSAALSGLTSNTTYHYRMVALRGGSVAASGADRTLTTGALPANSAPPAIAGVPKPGTPLTCSSGTWTGASAYAYQWLRDGAPLPANAETLTPASRDIGHLIACKVTATNTYGSASATSAAVRVVGLAPPRLSALKVSPRAFAATSSGSSIVTKRKQGTQVTFRLTETATVTFTVERAQSGRMVKGSFRWSGTQGANKFRFSGRLNGRKLARGSYRLVAHARNASGQVAAPVRVTFAIK